MQERPDLRIHNNVDETNECLFTEMSDCLLPSCVRGTQLYDKGVSFAESCDTFTFVYQSKLPLAVRLHGSRCE
jgi:hypothetical protein